MLMKTTNEMNRSSMMDIVHVGVRARGMRAIRSPHQLGVELLEVNISHPGLAGRTVLLFSRHLQTRAHILLQPIMEWIS